METILVKSRNMLVLPPNLSKKYGIRQGVKMLFQEENDHFKIFPMSKEIIDMNRGFLGEKAVLIKLLRKRKKKRRNYKSCLASNYI